MTNSEWGALNLPMVWSIFVGEYDPPDDVDLGEYLGNMELDLTTVASDGTYEVETGGFSFDDRLGSIYRRVRVGGVEVQNGEFVPAPTALACYAARALVAGYSPDDVAKGEAMLDHVFIEEMGYDPEERMFVLSTGS